jgi:hypothetical protein
MIEEKIEQMLDATLKLKEAIVEDIKDVKNANHEGLISRNDLKQDLMQEIVTTKRDLNLALTKALREGQSVAVYKEKIDYLELELKELYILNSKLAAIVLPVRQLYKEIVDELTQGDSSMVDIKA